MKPIPHRITQKELLTFSVHAFLCVARLMVFLMGWTKTRVPRALKRYLHSRERFLAQLFFLTALSRLRLRPGRRGHRSCGPGFRRTHGHIRLLLKSARLARKNAPLQTRILNLLDALAEPERYIRHFMKRLRKGLRLNHIVISAPQTDALAASPLYAVPCADSS